MSGLPSGRPGGAGAASVSSKGGAPRSGGSSLRKAALRTSADRRRTASDKARGVTVVVEEEELSPSPVKISPVARALTTPPGPEVGTLPHSTPRPGVQSPEQGGAPEPAKTPATTTKKWTPERPPELPEPTVEGTDPRRRAESEENMDDTIASLAAEVEAMERGEFTFTEEELRDGAGDLDSRVTRRLSMLPAFGALSGVTKDAAAERAGALFQLGKESLELATNMRRDAKKGAHEALNALYELALSLSDSRNRHRLTLEQERTRSAREMVRAQQAHMAEIRGVRANLEGQLVRIASELESNTKTIEGIQRWLSFEMDSPIKKIGTVHREVRALALTVSSVPTPATDAPTGTQDCGPQISALAGTLASHADHLRAIRVDVEKWRQAGEETLSTMRRAGSPPRAAPEVVSGDPEALQRIREDLNGLRELVIAGQVPKPMVPAMSRSEAREEIQEATRPLINLVRTLREEVAEVRDLSLAENGPINITAAGLGAELAISDARTIIEETMAPLRGSLEEMANSQRDMAGKLATYASVLAGAARRHNALADRGPAPEKRSPSSVAVGKSAAPVPQRSLEPKFGLVVESVDPRHSGEDVAKILRKEVDVVALGVGVDGLRKIRNGRVVVSCSTEGERNTLDAAIRETSAGLTTKPAVARNPRLRLVGVSHDLSDEQLRKALVSQNAALLEGVPEEEKMPRVVRRIKGRNAAVTNVVVEVAPRVWRALVDRSVRLGYQRVQAIDQSPVAQCYRCLGFGHLSRDCPASDQTCGYCADSHDTRECARRSTSPKCVNCGEEGHPAYSRECPVWQKWDRIARTAVRYC